MTGPETRLHFVKMQCAGNDFVVINSLGLPRIDWPAAARMLCRTRYGVGSDGLMIVEKAPRGGYLARMFNPDGSEDTCGNGMLCVAQFIRQEGLVDADSFQLDTRVGPKAVMLGSTAAGAGSVSVNMGVAEFDPSAIPADVEGADLLQRELDVAGETFTISSVSTGTPHTLIFCDALPDDDDFFRCAPMIERHPVFPEQTSVTWVKIGPPARVRLRTWERGGVGESLSCGTGACAVAAVGHRLGITSKQIALVSKGGELTVRLDDEGNAWLSGEPERVFEARIKLSDWTG